MDKPKPVAVLMHYSEDGITSEPLYSEKQLNHIRAEAVRKTLNAVMPTHEVSELFDYADKIDRGEA